MILFTSYIITTLVLCCFKFTKRLLQKSCYIIASTLKYVSMMVVKVLFLLAVLGLVSLPAASATVQQQQGECVRSVILA